jgi:hypothetical protein
MKQDYAGGGVDASTSIRGDGRSPDRVTDLEPMIPARQNPFKEDNHAE